MKGRLEHDRKNEAKALVLIADRPGYMMEYYNSFNDASTSMTKLNYIRAVLPFIDYLSNNGVINSEDISSFSRIMPRDINNYMTSLKYKFVNGVKTETKVTSRAAKYYGIQNFMKFLLYNEYIDSNPCDKVRPPKITEEIKVVSMDKDEISELKDNALYGSQKETHRQSLRLEKWRSRDMAIITLGCVTGLRVSSITEINMEDIEKNDDNWVINVTEKGNVNRKVLIGKSCIDTLKTWINDRDEILNGKQIDALFISERLERINQRNIQRIVKRCSDGIGKHITPHKMRSSCATNLYNATGDIYLVQEVLGHSNIKNTRRYAAVSNQKRQKAADILDNIG